MHPVATACTEVNWCVQYEATLMFLCLCASYPRSYFQVLHKFLTPKPRNNSHALGGTNVSDAAGAVGQNAANGGRTPLNISDIRRSIERYNDAQQVLNEELFGPVQNDSLIIVVQVRHILLPLCPYQLCSETHPAVPVSLPVVQ